MQDKKNFKRPYLGVGIMLTLTCQTSRESKCLSTLILCVCSSLGFGLLTQSIIPPNKNIAQQSPICEEIKTNAMNENEYIDKHQKNENK